MANKIYTVNENGINQLAEILKKQHKLGNELSRENLYAWASDVEDHLSSGDGAYIEISQFDHINGHTEIFYIDESGYDIEIDEDDDD